MEIINNIVNSYHEYAFMIPVKNSYSLDVEKRELISDWFESKNLKEPDDYTWTIVYPEYDSSMDINKLIHFRFSFIDKSNAILFKLEFG